MKKAKRLAIIVCAIAMLMSINIDEAFDAEF